MKSLQAAVLMLAVLPSAAAAFDWSGVPDWHPVFAGVELTDIVLTEPRPLRVHALRIDLDAAGVSVMTDRDNGDRPEEVDGLKTSTFLVRTGCQAAINGAPFWPGRKEEDQPQNVVGLVVADGGLVSPVDEAKPRAALIFRQGGRGSIERPPVSLEGIETAVGGFGVVLRAGRAVRPAQETDRFIDRLHPRTAVGLGPGGRTLLLLVVDGRQQAYSEGMNLAEVAETLAWLGAVDGLNLDGGGTTSMALAETAGGFRLVNRPIDGGVPGQERVSASHLGVFARPPPQGRSQSP